MRAIIKPCNFQLILDAVKGMAGHCVRSHTYATPSKTITIGHDIKSCAKLLKSQALQNDDKTMTENAVFSGTVHK